MQPRDIAHQVIEAVSGDLARCVEVDAVERLHDVRVVRDLEIRDNRLAEALDFDVLRIVFSDRDRRVDDVRDEHHLMQQFFLDLLLFCRQFIDAALVLGDFRLHGLGFFLLSLRHQCADLFRDLIMICSAVLNFDLDLAVLLIQCDDFVD